MKGRKRVEWTRLDNAAKIFPATSNEKDTKVFRFACELMSKVEPDLLQEALDETIEIFPLYKSVLRRGVFWYYLESSSIRPVVEEEGKPVCARLYQESRRTLLFRVFYYKNRVSLEIYHALSDGTGALWFLKTLLHQYFIRKYKEELKGNIPKAEYEASVRQKMDDSFQKHYTGMKISKGNLGPRAYHIRGTRKEENRMQLIEGSMSVKAVLAAAHEYNTTLTVYLTALFMYSIYKNMTEQGRKLPVVLSVPVNLRNYFESESARNFFSTIHISYDFGKNSTDFEALVLEVQKSFTRELSPDKLKNHIERLAALEHNAFTRAVPLVFKDLTLRLANYINNRGITAALSNIGKVTMPAEYAPFIKEFDVFTSAIRPQVCMCSYGDRLVVSFTSPYAEADIQKTFFQTLALKGIEVTVSANY
ncbi:hypothetical protein acsn021_33400 [Anaerocolumna cellulosilytica]|uniref:Uncharacterized protein n=1 Tax=Anaerocolumna cellulosilytica TaxID=433286 RepID=A0A6S6RA90_9FIRM|nr:hypothetical protein [Anaerocolumna cellulosilytica]MBB5196836.1 NRPS condensation-like uncharacterized protein [Anaerocolumna cellulosilytica]BCJ95771.1 hypothetical protein acsn021_33400 [Anaerocolumna cellulosilytica]